MRQALERHTNTIEGSYSGQLLTQVLGKTHSLSTTKAVAQ
jgi:hypothetical protein